MRRHKAPKINQLFYRTVLNKRSPASEWEHNYNHTCHNGNIITIIPIVMGTQLQSYLS